MTFRTRVIAATVAAAAIAVIIACFASYFTTRSALFNSVDQSLVQASKQPLNSHFDDRLIGASSEIVLPNREMLNNSNIPTDPTVMNAAEGKTTAQVIRTITIGNQSYRELVVPLPANSILGCSQSGVCQQISTTSAQLIVVDVTGQVTELSHLVSTLMLVAAGGLLLAFGLGLFLARQALHPLEEVTNEIETVATTNDLQYRLVEGDEDELGRLRRVFNRLLRSVESSQSLQRQLVVDASHELRTPLTSLRTNAQVLSRASELSDEELHQITDDMITQVDELAALVTASANWPAANGPRVRSSGCASTTAWMSASRLRVPTPGFATSPSSLRWRPRTSKHDTSFEPSDLESLNQRREVHA